MTKLTLGLRVTLGFALFAAGVALGGCGATTPPGASADAAAASDRPPVADAQIATAPATSSVRCSDPAPIASPDALAAIDAGRYDDALETIREALTREPGRASLLALQVAAQDAKVVAQIASEKAVAGLTPVVAMPAPTAPSHPQPIAVNGAIPRLRITSQQPNKIIDDDKWARENDVSLPRLDRQPGGIPAFLPDVLRGLRLSQAIHHPDHLALVYGHRLVVVVDGEGEVVAVVDAGAVLTGGGRGQSIDWAEARHGALFVASSNPLYARESNGQNAFITAIDLETGAIRWRSQPLVSNAQSFVISGGGLICGYGFTAESDYLYVLRLADGTVAQELPLATSPSTLVRKDDRLFVRGYNTDYVVAIADNVAAPSGSVRGDTGVVLAGSSIQPPPPFDTDRCLRDRALAELDRGDRAAALATLGKLSSAYHVNPAVPALIAELRHAHETGRMPLPLRAQALAAPPFAAMQGDHPSIARGTPPKLAQRSRTEAGRDPDFLPRKQPFAPLLHTPQLGFRDGPDPQWPADVPLRFGNHELRRVIRYADHMMLVYGDAQLVIMREGRGTTAFDLSTYRIPPRFQAEEWARYGEQDVTWAEARDGVVYVTNGGGSYAREVYGKKGFMSAIRESDGELLWRSDPLVSGANFVIRGGYIITGYGFTDEPDFLFVLDRQSGKTVSRSPLDSAPMHFLLTGDELKVRTFHSDYLFALR